MILSQAVLMFAKSDNINKSVSFLMITLTCATWSIGLSIFLISKDVVSTHVSAQVYYIAAAGIAWSALIFSSYITHYKHHKVLCIVSSVPFLLLSLWLVFFSHTMLVNVNIGEPNTIDLGLTVYAVYVLYFALYTITSIAILTGSLLKSTNAVEKRRRLYILLSYVFGISIGALFNLLLPLFGNYILIWVGPIGASIFAFFVYMSTRHYRLFYARLLFTRMVVLLTLVVTHGLAYFLAQNVLEQFIRVTVVESTILAVLLAMLTAIIVTYSMKFIDRKFSPHLLNSKLLDQISRISLRYTTIEQIIRDTVESMMEYLDKGDSVHIDLYMVGKHAYYDSDGVDLRIDNVKEVQKYIDNHEYNVIVTEEIKDHKTAYGLLTSKNITIVVRIGDNGLEDEDDPSYGYLTICAKRSKLYSDQEVKVLATIGSILAMAIKNTGHYEKIKKFNDELKEEVDNATHGLKIANQRLVKLNDTKDEFLSLASHQLRTPLTSVKGYLSMLLDGDFGEMTPTQKKIISDSFNSSQQMAVTISDFLDMSRIQTGRFTLSKESTDLAEILEFQLNQLQTTAQSRNVELTSEIDNDLPQVDVDRDKIAQVMMNFIDNAIYYSKPDSGVVKVSLYKDSNNLVFKVRDNGIGVPDDEKHHLFTKFYRADNAKAARPNGTGVGLYVARKVIVAHRGQIIFESKVGKGSMFGFKIPMG